MKIKEEQYHRKVQTAVTVFLHKDGQYLFIKRNLNKRVDPGRLNGVGGRLDPGEDFLTTCIREVKEETGYVLQNEKIDFCGIYKLEGGYSEDWLVGVFRAEVESFEIPKGSITDDGELIWIDQDEVLDTKFELVSDIYYTFKDIRENKRMFFFTAQLNDEEKIINSQISYLDK
jgi:8-oxo-dGTP pyrophosphatase MutT (NUDIX family)